LSSHEIELGDPEEHGRTESKDIDEELGHAKAETEKKTELQVGSLGLTVSVEEREDLSKFLYEGRKKHRKAQTRYDWWSNAHLARVELEDDSHGNSDYNARCEIEHSLGHAGAMYFYGAVILGQGWALLHHGFTFYNSKHSLKNHNLPGVFSSDYSLDDFRQPLFSL
jgi:hypothetical protein